MALIQTQAARSFVELVGTDAGRRATMGDHRKYPSGPATKLARVHMAVSDAIARLNGLSKDETRSLPERHQAGQQLAKNTVDEINKTRAELKDWVVKENAAAMEEIESTLKGDVDTASQVQRAEIRAFCLSRKGDADFAGELKNLVETDIRFANAVLEAPAALSGISSERQMSLRMSAAVKHCPNAAGRIEVANEIAGLDAKLARVASEIPRSFYNPQVADGMRTRIDVDAPFTRPEETAE